uniref:Reprolysin n=1 Tax=Rhipicephalus zambeziensis TaxID=60191 RepID=A0A224YEA6_9ACAR
MEKHKQYPGQTVRALHYCKRQFMKKSGEKWFVKKSDNLKRMCKMHCCQKRSAYGSACWRTTMLSGMPCGQGKTCRRGVCGLHHFP